MFKLIPRRSLIIYINNNRVIRALRRYGRIDYISRRMHYVVMYVMRQVVILRQNTPLL